MTSRGSSASAGKHSLSSKTDRRSRRGPHPAGPGPCSRLDGRGLQRAPLSRHADRGRSVRPGFRPGPLEEETLGLFQKGERVRSAQSSTLIDSYGVGRPCPDLRSGVPRCEAGTAPCSDRRGHGGGLTLRCSETRCSCARLTAPVENSNGLRQFRVSQTLRGILPRPGTFRGPGGGLSMVPSGAGASHRRRFGRCQLLYPRTRPRRTRRWT
jgi:hypothetical protein